MAKNSRTRCFSEMQLDYYANNSTNRSLTERIKEHLGTCETCNDEVMERAAFKKLITKRTKGKPKGIHRLIHPSLEDIEDLCYQRTSKLEVEGIAEHLTMCDECYGYFKLARLEQQLTNEGKIPPYEPLKELPPKLKELFDKNQKYSF